MSYILLENRKANPHAQASLYFTNPCEKIICFTKDELIPCLDKLDEQRKLGRYLAGFVSYEAGHYLVRDTNAEEIDSADFPLLYFLSFPKVESLTQSEVAALLQQKAAKANQAIVSNLALNMPNAIYNQEFAKIKSHLIQGNTYQVNLTTKYNFSLHGDKVLLYQQLRDRQKVEYGALMELDSLAILSFSPELFFAKQKTKITVKPMKGTTPRSACPKQDKLNKQKLTEDSKLIAENVIIVDLLRNDLGRIANRGSVKVSEFLAVTSFETLHQMTSTIKAKIDHLLPIKTIFQNLFPCGSITGAPKYKTMQIIQDCETGPRNIYTGSIGYITPDNDMCFNVAIRTLLLQDGKGELGVGGAITYDSCPEEEFAELKLKANFFTQMEPQFKLLESLLYDSTTGYFLLDEHLARLKHSAMVFDFVYDENLIRELLQNKNLKEGVKYKVRLILTKLGAVKLEFSEIPLNTRHKKQYIKLYEDECVRSDDILLYHKTTKSRVREFFDRVHAQLQDNYTDVVFMNEQGFITESSRANIFIELNGQCFTPPLSAGLLAGIMRHKILQENPTIKERNLSKKDLEKADRIWLCNSVRGMREVHKLP